MFIGVNVRACVDVYVVPCNLKKNKEEQEESMTLLGGLSYRKCIDRSYNVFTFFCRLAKDKSKLYGSNTALLSCHY